MQCSYLIHLRLERFGDVEEGLSSVCNLLPGFIGTFGVFLSFIPSLAFFLTGNGDFFWEFFGDSWLILFWVSVEEEIDWNFPVVFLSELSSQDQDFTGQEPVNHGDGLGVTVVAWDGNVDVLEG